MVGDNIEKLLEVKVDVLKIGTYKFKLDYDSTCENLKEQMKRKTKSMPTDLRLLYKGQEILSEVKLADFHHKVHETLNLVGVGAMPKSEVHKKVNNLRLLKRNVDECVNCVKTGSNPRERTRYNDPESKTPTHPDTKYLGNILLELGSTFREMSSNFNQLTDLLREVNLAETTEIYEANRRIVQNNMDTVRYANPMLQNLTKLKIPLNQPESLVQVIPETQRISR
jgi:hypothetical protein